MSTYEVAGQVVNGNPTGNTNINITTATIPSIIFYETNNQLGAPQAGELVSLDGGLTQLSYVYLGHGNVRGDPLQHAAFIRVNLGNNTFQTIAIDLNADGDGVADLQNGNTQLSVNGLNTTPQPWPYPPCFVAGTRIRVPGGEVAVEEIAVGDLVETMDHGPQPVRWIGRRRVRGSGDFAPVRIEAGVLGNVRVLLVSPQHRMLITGWRAELLFGEAEILIAAKHLAGLAGISFAPADRVEYVHLMFDRHEIIFAESAATESFFPGSAMLGPESDMRSEVGRLFPELFSPGRHRSAVRPFATAREARVLTG
jgi:Hint domain